MRSKNISTFYFPSLLKEIKGKKKVFGLIINFSLPRTFVFTEMPWFQPILKNWDFIIYEMTWEATLLQGDKIPVSWGKGVVQGGAHILPQLDAHVMQGPWALSTFSSQTQL